MRHTVIGFFRNISDANRAVDALRQEGYNSDDIDVAPNTDRDTDQEERSGRIGSFFKSLFGDDDNDSNRYSLAARENTLVTVHAADPDDAEKAADILDSYGAIDIEEPSSDKYSEAEYEHTHSQSATGETFSGSDYERTGFTSDKDLNKTSEASIPVVEEDVNIGKREVRRGSVRIRSRVIERPVEETLRLREERIHIERNPVDRDIADDTDFKEETIEVEAYGEEPLISKRKRVVEEVKVGKSVHERSETVRENQRRTEVDIEHDNPDDPHSENRDLFKDRDRDVE